MKRNRLPGFFVVATAVACASGCSTGTSRAREEFAGDRWEVARKGRIIEWPEAHFS